jgi:hypothetical protein
VPSIIVLPACAKGYSFAAAVGSVYFVASCCRFSFSVAAAVVYF